MDEPKGIISKDMLKKPENADLNAFDRIQFHTWEDSWLVNDAMMQKMVDIKIRD